MVHHWLKKVFAAIKNLGISPVDRWWEQLICKCKIGIFGVRFTEQSNPCFELFGGIRKMMEVKGWICRYVGKPWKHHIVSTKLFSLFLYFLVYGRNLWLSSLYEVWMVVRRRRIAVNVLFKLVSNNGLNCVFPCAVVLLEENCLGKERFICLHFGLCLFWAILLGTFLHSIYHWYNTLHDTILSIQLGTKNCWCCSCFTKIGARR